MKPEFERNLKSKLVKDLDTSISNFLDYVDPEDIDEVPYIGENFFEILADAVLTVIKGMSDAESYMRKQGILKDE